MEMMYRLQDSEYDVKLLRRFQVFQEFLFSLLVIRLNFPRGDLLVRVGLGKVLVFIRLSAIVYCNNRLDTRKYVIATL